MAFDRNPYRFDPRGFDINQPQRNVFSFGAREPAPISTPPPRFGASMPKQELGGWNSLNIQPSEQSPVVPGSRFSMDLTPPPMPQQDSSFNEPDFTNVKKFIDVVQNQPRREDYKPNVWQNIIGGLGAAGNAMVSPQGAEGAFKTTEALRYAPFTRATEDWASKAGAYGKAAEAEIKTEEVGNKWLTMMNNMYNQQSLAASRDATAQYNRGRLEQGQQKIDQDRREQQDAVNAKRDEGWTTVRANGRVYSKNPITKESIDHGIDRGIEIAAERAKTAGYAAETGRINAGTAQGQLGVAKGRLDLAKGLQPVQIENMRSAIEHRKALEAGTTTTTERDVTDYEQQVITNNEMRKMMLANPKYADLFDEDGQLDPDKEGDPLHIEFMNDLDSRIKSRIGTGKRKTTTTRGRVGGTSTNTDGVIDYNSLPGGAATTPAKPTTPWWK